MHMQNILYWEKLEFFKKKWDGEIKFCVAKNILLDKSLMHSFMKSSVEEAELYKQLIQFYPCKNIRF